MKFEFIKALNWENAPCLLATRRVFPLATLATLATLLTLSTTPQTSPGGHKLCPTSVR